MDKNKSDERRELECLYNLAANSGKGETAREKLGETVEWALSQDAVWLEFIYSALNTGIKEDRAA